MALFGLKHDTTIGTMLEGAKFLKEKLGLNKQRTDNVLPSKPGINGNTQSTKGLPYSFRVNGRDKTPAEITNPGNVSLLQGPTSPVKTGLSQGSPVTNFGLPTNRMPTFNELGGALGQISQYVNQLTMANRKRGLSPGYPVNKLNSGLPKARLGALVKLYEVAKVSGDEEEAARLKSQLDAIIGGGDNGDSDALDLEAIYNLS